MKLDKSFRFLYEEVFLGVKEIAIIGSGKLAWHLYQALEDHVQLSIYSRSRGIFPEEISILPISEIRTCFGIILAVSDNAISQISESISLKSTPIIHSSGATKMQAIQNEHIGVFYPCISFPKQGSINWSQVPILTEANSTLTQEFIQFIIQKLDIRQVIKADSEQRLKLHLAAVFQHNFSVMLSQIAHNILEEAELPSYLLHGTKTSLSQAIQSYQPFEFMTGPAFRDDQTTMDAHLKLLEENSDMQTLYQLLSEQIKRSRH